MPKTKSRIILAVLALLVYLPAQAVRATPSCIGKSMNIVAHEDDDIIFLNPAIQQDINSGKCVQTVYVTAGDAGVGDYHWQSRENGMRTAYANMAGVSNSWTSTSINISGHALQLSTLEAKPQIQLLFMRLPDGGLETGYESNYGQTLKKLWLSTIDSVAPKDSTESYSKQDVIDVILQCMINFGPDMVRTQNFLGSYGAVADHNDHISSAYFARAAHQLYRQPHQFVGFRGYDIINEATNIAGVDLSQKQNAFFAYNAYDDNQCLSVSACKITNMLPWLARAYVAGTETRNTQSTQTLDGDAKSISQEQGEIGQAPTAITFLGNIYAFYYDKTSGQLRYAKSSSSDNSQWDFGTLDSYSGSIGQTPTAAIYNDQLYVFYYDGVNGNLRHARTIDGVNWTYQNLDGDPGSVAHSTNYDVGLNPTATVYGNTLQVFYYDKTNGNLRHAWLGNQKWSFETLEGDNGSISHFSSDTGLDPTVTVYHDTLQLYHYDKTNGNLRHAWSDNTGWHFENLDGYTTDNGRRDANVGSSPTTTVYNDTVQLFYYDTDAGNLRHAWSDSTGWHFENLEGDVGSITRHNGNVGATPYAIVYDSTLHVFAYDTDNQGLRHYWASTTQGWRAETVDTDGGEDPMAIPYGTKLNVFYYQANGSNLRHALL